MRILHVIRSDGWAGVERHVAELARAQTLLGDEVTVVGGDVEQMQAVVGDAVHVVPAVRTTDVTLAVTRIRGRFDVVNTHMTAADVGAAIAPRHRSAALISTRHFAAPRGTALLSREAFRYVRRRLAGQVAVSRYVAAQVDGPSRVVLSGVRSDDGLVPASGRSSSILVAQRLEGEKRGELVVRAFAASALAAEGWSLEVAGDGALRPRLERLARELDIGGAVHFLGYRGDVHELMRGAGIFIAGHPSEAFGLSVVEAMARGLPVVAAGAGAHLETVGSVADPALFAPDDVPDAARVLRELALDEERRDDYGRRLQEAQRERFTVELQARRTDAAFRDFLGAVP